MSNETTIQKIKDWFTFIVAVVACVAGVIFWIQQANDGKFKQIEKDIVSLQVDIDKIESNNDEILRIIGRLEGKIDQ